ncbi:DUF4435 domain-containing protein [uncultured Thiodictyon sp.]|uniref:DUF4435 domain-containing protein n=1 Tax=uncultured Thiodictyon sp. TaxID=1846217 RepID=UPI0025CE15C3|nr:DUF4435 domain-containing protein [uncultured Thiodictyon sp.]
MNINEIRDRIRQEFVGAQEKRVFLVEGSDDVTAWQILLNRFVPDWETHWAIAQAGSKSQLLRLLDLEPHWLGLVDRDEWDQTVIEANTRKRSNLLVLPRFCLENYLIDPGELWPAIPVVQQETITGGQATLETVLHAQLDRYIRHGALWMVVTPLWTGLRALGFKEALASEDSLETAQDDDEVRRILRDWDELLDPERIFADFETQLARTRAAPVSQQYAQWVHGKYFWQQVVSPAMTKLFGQMSEARRRIEILRQIPKPADLQPVFDRLAT